MFIGEYDFFIKLSILALIVFIGMQLMSRCTKRLMMSLGELNKDDTLKGFIFTAGKWLLFISILLLVMNFMGINTTSLGTLISATIISVGLVLKESISNLAYGILISYFKPFKVGDIITVNDVKGAVIKIDLLQTTLVNHHNTTYVVSNYNIYNGVIANHTVNNNHFFEIKLKLPFDTDTLLLNNVVLKIISESDKFNIADHGGPNYCFVDNALIFSVLISVETFKYQEDRTEFTIKLRDRLLTTTISVL